MYYPIQIPYIMNREYVRHMKYTEEQAQGCSGFVICFWYMEPITNKKLDTECVIAADACIDLVANLDDGMIGFAGMSKTNFHHKMSLPERFLGARLMPGAFHRLSGLPASSVMDDFLPIESVLRDFDKEYFFSLSFHKAKDYFKAFLMNVTGKLVPDRHTMLFNSLAEDTPSNAGELYRRLGYGPRKCQRLFSKHYGIPPKMALSILRFQKCLYYLTVKDVDPADVLDVTEYYDQPHFINDFKRYMGITPMELIRVYQR